MSDQDPFDWNRPRRVEGDEPLELRGGMPPPRSLSAARVPLRTPTPSAPVPPPIDPDDDDDDAYLAPGSYTTNLPVAYRPSPWRWAVRGAAALLLLVILAIAWLTITAPLSKSLRPPAPPSITLLASDGTPIARRGANIGDPVDATQLPDYVREAFVAIEDRRFYSHWGVDPRGVLRAAVHNATTEGDTQGGSTITQQLAKNAFLDSSRNMGRKFQEALIAFWLESWLTKDEILSRYLSYVYFGDNAYGLSAAARHYFSTTPDKLTLSQATMLAGLVQAPSRLAPTGNLTGARERQKLVIASMVDAGFLTEEEGEAVKPAVLKTDHVRELPIGTYFADWVLPQARDRAGEIATEQTVRTTLDMRMQREAEAAVRRASLGGAQVALVAMRPDGRVVAMVGGRKYSESQFNRVTQARRQPGSTFKLFVYLAALRSGMTPDSTVADEPVTIGDWSPSNSDGRYLGDISLRQAFARSSNVAAARLTQKVGPRAVIRAARDLGISTDIPNEASIALGTANVSLLELTAAYAAIASGETPVRPRGLPEEEDNDVWLAQDRTRSLGRREVEGMRTLLASVVSEGTGRRAALSIDAFGKTGTTQDNRDVWFVGYAGDLVVGVWVGNDDNSPSTRLRSSLPAGIWHDFMVSALRVAPRPVEPEPAVEEAVSDDSEFLENGITFDVPEIGLEGEISGRGFNLRIGPNDELIPLPPTPPDGEDDARDRARDRPEVQQRGPERGQ